MPENKKSDRSDGGFRLAVQKTVTASPDLLPPEEILHSKVDARIENTRAQITRTSPRGLINPDSMLAMHFYNVPLYEADLLTKDLYEIIESAARKHQLDNGRSSAFFSDHSELCISFTGENVDTWSTQEMRYHYKMFSSRLANHLARYVNDYMMYAASLANLGILSKVNGDNEARRIGTMCKIGFINSAANAFAKFYPVNDILTILAKWSKFAVGQSTTGALFTSIPWWRMEVYGNRSTHAPSIIGTIAKNFSDDGATASSYNGTGRDEAAIDKLYNNIIRTIKYFGSATKHEGHFLHYISDQLNLEVEDAVPILSDPFHENGGIISFTGLNTVYSGSLTDSGLRVHHGVQDSRDPKTKEVTNSDNVVSRAWTNFLWMQAYMLTYYPEMQQDNSVMAVFACDTLKITSNKRLTASQFINNINNDGYFDAEELLDRMRYKSTGTPNCATIVHWVPIFDDRHHNWKDNDTTQFWKWNFERFQPEVEDDRKYLELSRVWPRLTPTVFTRVDDEEDKDPPLVVNTIPEYGLQTPGETAINTHFATTKPIIGRRSTYLDMVSCCAINSEDNLTRFAAVSPDDAKKVITNNQGFVIESDPMNVRLYRMPIINNTDPSQCGFYLLVNPESLSTNEYASWFKDGANFKQNHGDTETRGVYTPPTGTGAGNSKLLPNQATFLEEVSGSSTPYALNAANMFNSSYFKAMYNVLVFVGEGLFGHPAMAALKLHSGCPSEAFKVEHTMDSSMLRVFYGDETEGSELTGFYPAIENLTSAMTEDPSGALTASGDKSFELAIMLYLAGAIDDTHIDTTKIVDSLSTFQSICDVVGENDHWLEYYLFNPLYGSVPIAVKYTPGESFLPMIPKSRDTFYRDVTAGAAANAGPLEPAVGTARITTTKDVPYSIAGQVNVAVWDSRFSPALYYFAFIDLFVLRKVYTPSQFGDRIADNPTEFVGCVPAVMAAFSLLSHSRVLYSGVEDAVHLAAVPADKAKIQTQDLGVAGYIKYAPYVEGFKMSYSVKAQHRMQPRQKTPRVVHSRKFTLFASSPVDFASAESVSHDSEVKGKEDAAATGTSSKTAGQLSTGKNKFDQTTPDEDKKTFKGVGSNKPAKVDHENEAAADTESK